MYPYYQIFSQFFSAILIVLRETTLAISDSIETGSQVESQIVKVVSLCTKEIARSKLEWCPGTCQAHITLTLGLPEKMFQMAPLLKVENNCANLYWNPSKTVGVDRNLTFKHDLDLGSSWNKCFKWHIYMWWRTIVSNYFEIHQQL